MASPMFRESTAQDRITVEELLVRCSLPVEGVREHFADFLLAFDNGRLVACGGLEYHGDVALLRSVAVEAGHRGRGLGKRLVAELLAAAATHGARSVVLLTTTAEDFFARMGFRVVPRNAVPAALKASEEFKGACPQTATAMMMTPGARKA